MDVFNFKCKKTNEKYQILIGQGQKKGPKIEMELQVTLEELFSGKSFDVEVNKQMICHHCRGSGAKDPSDVKSCNSCNGQGMSKMLYH